MPAVLHCSRIDTFELKLQMERRLGSQKGQTYFNLLTRYLSLKLGKSEFDKLCIHLIGRDNIHLHNEFIKAIVKNATLSNTPPPKKVKHDGPCSLTFKDPNGTQGLQYVFPQSPRKGRTPNLRERKFKDRPSPLGINNKTHEAQDLTTKRIHEQENATQLLSLSSKQPIEVEHNGLSPVNYNKSLIRAPFGIKIQPKETRKFLSSGFNSSYHTDTCHYSGELPCRDSLGARLKQKLKMEGLDISTDCVNLLNNGLDSYLKRVIKPGLELASSRSIQEPGRGFETSLLDFWVGTEISPKILGEYRSTQIEKVNLFDLKRKIANGEV